MQRNFCKELKEFINQMDTSKQIKEQLYEIRKRSVPIKIDKLVGTGFTKFDAEFALQHLIRKEQRRRNTSDINVYFMYDIIPINATSKERSVYHNEGPASL